MAKNRAINIQAHIILKVAATFGLFSFLCITACTSSQKSKTQTPLTVDQEKIFSRETLPEVRQNYPICKDAEIQNYVSDIGIQIVRTNNLELTFRALLTRVFSIYQAPIFSIAKPRFPDLFQVAA